MEIVNSHRESGNMMYSTWLDGKDSTGTKVDVSALLLETDCTSYFM